MKRSWFSILAGVAFAINAAAADNPVTLALGSPEPDFDLPGVDGRNWRLKDFADAEGLAL